MFKRILILAGILFIAFTIFSLGNRFGEVPVSDNEEGQASFTTHEALSIAKLKEKLHEIYVGVDVKTTPKKELVLQVVADEDYFNFVKKDMEPIAKSAIESTSFQDYTVVFERWELTSRNTEHNKIDKGVSHFLKMIVEGLNDYEVFKNIVTDRQSFITIQTTIDGSGEEAQTLALELEETVNEILQFQERNQASQMDAYEIKIVNLQGKVLNK